MPSEPATDRLTDHAVILKRGIEQWNEWRSQQHSPILCNLSKQDLSNGYFFEGNFSRAQLKHTNLQRACLIGADLSGADLSGADLSGAYLGDANLQGANLSNANLSKANLERADLRHTNLFGTNLADADISTARLPNPHIDPYPDFVLTLLAQHASLQQSKAADLAAGLAAETTASDQQARATFRAGLLAKMQQPIASLSMKNRESERIRTRRDLSKQKSLAQKTDKKEWGRRAKDQQFFARLRYRLRQPQIKIPLAAASLFLAVGLPFSLTHSSRWAVTTPAQTQFALAKSLTGSGQVWTVATQVQSSGEAWVIGGSSDGNIEIWNGETGELLRTMSGHTDGVRSLAISPSGEWLVSGGEDGLKAWQPNTGELVYSIPDAMSPVWSVAISPDGRSFISSDYNGTITAWDLSSGQRQYQIDNGSPVWSVAMSPDGKSFVGGSDDLTVRQWDLATGEMIQEFVGHTSAIHAVAISADGTQLASGGWDSSIKVWDIASGQLQTTFNAHSSNDQNSNYQNSNDQNSKERIVSLAISPDGRTLASGSSDNTVKVWDLSNQQLAETLEDHTNGVYAIAFDADGQTLISAGKDQTVKVWQ